MGFWSFMTKMVKGEPVFQDEPEKDDWDEPVANPKPPQEVVEPKPETSPLIDERGNKMLPEVEIIGCQYKLSGEYVEVWADIRNESPREIMLDKIRMLGHAVELDRTMKPGERREYKIYSGKMLRHDSYRTAELYYKDQASGDYFCAVHAIEYRLDGDGRYTPEGFRLLRPIKDV